MSNGKLFGISLVAVLLMAAVMLFTESQSGAEEGIIIKLELSPSLEQLESLLQNYNDEQLWWLRLNTLLDFVFIVCYSSLFFFSLKGVLNRSLMLRRFTYFSFLAFLPGILDVIENAFILSFLKRQFDTPFYEVYYWFVHAKWFLVTVCIVLSLIELGLMLKEKFLVKRLS